MAKKPKDPPVTVRMYRQGLGDCFLISIWGTRPFHMLIDCGVWDVSKEAAKRVHDCAEDIKQTIGGKRLDLLVITHEHWDHVSGFSERQARDVFDTFEIGELLLPWTENPDDTLAGTIRENFQKLKLGLQNAVKSAAGAGLALGEGTTSVLAASGLALGTDPGEALGWIKRRSNESPDTKVTYCRPGEVLNIPGARVYVLGPPHDEVALRKHLGGVKAEKEGETYLHAAEMDDLLGSLNLGVGSAFAAAERRAMNIDNPWGDKGRPFSAEVGLPLQGALKEGFWGAVYGSPKGAGKDQWRRIDSDWTSSVAQLALRMDKFTNNTSLVLAIELTESNRVLLFPGDAQFGNWMSWDSVKFESRPETTAEDLLRRTVLYKVGHHGSHNATLRKRGVDRMTSQDLVAMIPVNEAFARKQPNGGWNMPYPALFEDLKMRTQGRILRADSGLPSATDLKPAVRAKFVKNAKEDKKKSLWVEWRL